MALTLRKYQESAVDYLLSEEVARLRWGLVVMPTGSGKTPVAKAAISASLDQSTFRRVIVVTPDTIVEDRFLREENISSKRGGAPSPLRLLCPRELQSSKLEFFRSWVSKSSSVDPHVLVTTYDQFRRFEEELPKNCSHLLLLVDEGHHAGSDEDTLDPEATKIRQLTALLHQRGGTIWQFTATPSRADMKGICPPSVTPHIVPYHEPALEEPTPSCGHGVLPKQISVRVVALQSPDIRTSDAGLIECAEAIRKSGRVTVVKVSGGGREPFEAYRLAERLAEALKSVGFKGQRVLNMVTPPPDVMSADRFAKEVNARIQQENETLSKKGFRGRTIDVAITCQRGREGMDFPSCSAIAFLGAGTSVPATLQNVGRATRSKWFLEGFPEEHRDSVEVTFFVPASFGEEFEQRRVAKMVTQVALGLEVSPAQYDFLRLWPGMVESFRIPPALRSSVSIEEMFRKHLSGIGKSLPEDNIEIGEVLFGTGLLARGALGRNPTPKELAEHLNLPRDSKTLRALARILSEFPKHDVADVERLNDAITNEVKRRGALTTDVEVVDTLCAAFEALIEQKMSENPSFVVPIDQKLASWTARGFEGRILASELERLSAEAVDARDKAFSVSDFDLAKKLFLPYKKEHGRLLSARDRDFDVSYWLGVRMRLSDVEAGLRRRGLDVATFAAMVDVGWVTERRIDLGKVEPKVRLRRGVAEKEVTATNILAHRDPKSLPSKSRVMVNGKVESLLGLQLAAKYGWRGFEAGTALSSLVD